MRSGVPFERGVAWFAMLLIALLALAGCQEESPPANDPTADVHPNVSQFGQLVGNWRIEQQVRQQDGSWEEVDPAEWHFRYALGGHAVQDYWIQPPGSAPLTPGVIRQYGTNIRIYDPLSDSWRIVWAASDQSTFTMYSARANERGELVMTGDDATRPGVTQRITYFDIADDQWQWRMEFSRDDENWVEVARIRASRTD